MSAGFTPAPWEATERHDYHEIIGPRPKSDWYGRKGVWAVAYADTDRSVEEQIANAQLISAAPELLEALTECHEIMHRATAVLSNSDCAAVAAAMGRARAAITKATGGEA